MRPVYMLSGGITKFAKAHPAKDFRLMVNEAFDAALADLGGKLTPADLNGSVISYFSDHFTGQLKAGAMVQDFVGLCPKPNIRIEGSGAGICRTCCDALGQPMVHFVSSPPRNSRVSQDSERSCGTATFTSPLEVLRKSLNLAFPIPPLPAL